MAGFKRYLILFIALSNYFLILAQTDSTPEYSRFSAKIAIGNQAVGFPFQHSFSASNPHGGIGIEFRLNKSLTHQLLVSSNLGFFRNKVIGNSITSDLDFGYRYSNKTGLFLETSLDLGLIRQYHPRDIYAYDNTEGTYVKVDNKGVFASLVGFRMGIGYDFSKKSNHPFHLGINHHFFIQSPYFDVANFPIMPQSTTNIVFTYKFKKS